MLAGDSWASRPEGRLRPLSGKEEELLAGDRGTNAAALCNELVARCLTRPGRDPSAARGEVAELLVTDRDFALVALRRHSLGNDLALELTCSSCGAVSDVSIDLARLSPPAPAPREVVVEQPALRARVRLPTARDQERVVASAGSDVRAARAALLAATLVELNGERGPFSTSAVEELDPASREAIDGAVEAALPDIDLALTTVCPACGAAVEAPVHLAEVVLAELCTRSRRLLREVHVLASQYHWSERQILSLSVSRRLAYLALIEAERAAALVAGAR